VIHMTEESKATLRCDFRDDVAYLSFGGQRWGPVETQICDIGDGEEIVGIDVDELANRVLGLDFGGHARSLFRWLYERSPETAELILALTYEPTGDVLRVDLGGDDGSGVVWSQVRCARGHWRVSFGMKDGRGIVALVMPAAAAQLPPEVIAGATRTAS
jgi:hypothetical protein